jgi:ABC-type amino acid transport substrate-binding protein
MSFTCKADLIQEIKSIQEKGELVVAMMSKDQKPFFMKTKAGELIGFDVEIAQEVARRLKVKLRFDRSAQTYDDVVDAVAQGKADMGISMLSFTPRRGLKALFTKPYFTLYKAAIINRVSIARAGEVSIKELLGPGKWERKKKTSNIKQVKPVIGVLTGTAYVRYVKVTFPECEIIESESWSQLVDKVTKGELTAAFSDSNDIKLAVTQDPNIVIDIKPVILKAPDYLYIAYSNKYPYLADFIDLVLKNDDNFTISYEQLVERYESEMEEKE